jgi:hypothetical protein
VETEKSSDDKTEEAREEPSSCQGSNKNTVGSGNDESRGNRCVEKHV